MQRSLIGLATALGLVTAAALGDEPMKGGLAYRISVDSNVKLAQGDDKPSSLRAQAEFDYRLGRENNRIEVAVDRIGLLLAVDGQETTRAEMGRPGIFGREAGKEQNAPRAGAKPQLVALLDQFEAPLAVIVLDAEGGEVAREVKVKGGPLGASGALETTRVFHPRFPRDKTEWDAPALVPLGDGKMARGTLHYAKRPGAPPRDPVEVDVTGKLEASGKIDGAEIKGTRYEVKGVQTYDTKLREWVAGKLVVAMDFQSTQPDGTTLRGKGPLTITLTRRDGKDGAKTKTEP
jgi:hypothetical protein